MVETLRLSVISLSHILHLPVVSLSRGRPGVGPRVGPHALRIPSAAVIRSNASRTIRAEQLTPLLRSGCLRWVRGEEGPMPSGRAGLELGTRQSRSVCGRCRLGVLPGVLLACVAACDGLKQPPGTCNARSGVRLARLWGPTKPACPESSRRGSQRAHGSSRSKTCLTAWSESGSLAE